MNLIIKKELLYFLKSTVKNNSAVNFDGCLHLTQPLITILTKFKFAQ